MGYECVVLYACSSGNRGGIIAKVTPKVAQRQILSGKFTAYCIFTVAIVKEQSAVLLQ